MKYLFLLIIFLLAACQAVPEAVAPAPQANATVAQANTPLPQETAPLPVTGVSADALALTIREKTIGSTLEMLPVLAKTGQAPDGYSAIDLGSNVQYAFTPDLARMAFLSYGAQNCAAYCFHLVDLPTWKEIITPIEVVDDPSVWGVAIVFDETLDRAAFALNEQNGTRSILAVVDLAAAKITAQVDRSEAITGLSFTPSGALAAYGGVGGGGPDELLRALLFDPSTLALTWEQDLTELAYGQIPSEDAPDDPMLASYLSPGAVFSPDGAKLYLVAADEDRLHTVDFEGRAVTSAFIQPPRSLLDRLMALGAGVARAKLLNGASKGLEVSADGQHLFVVGQVYTSVKQKNGEYSTQRTPLDFQVIEAASGTELFRMKSEASNLELSSDGKTVFLHSWPVTESGADRPYTQLYDTAAGEVQLTLQGEIRPTRLLNGQQAWLQSEWFNERSRRISLFAPGDVDNPLIQQRNEGSYIDWIIVK